MARFVVLQIKAERTARKRRIEYENIEAGYVGRGA